MQLQFVTVVILNRPAQYIAEQPIQELMDDLGFTEGPQPFWGVLLVVLVQQRLQGLAGWGLVVQGVCLCA
jgi:hypothetical protein